MKTKNAVRIISFCLAAVLVSVGFLIKEVRENNHYKLELQNSYSKNFDDFNAAVNNISLTLNKLKYVTSKKQLSAMATELLSEAEISKSALSQMPQTKELTTLNRFFSQVGNYAMSLAISMDDVSALEENEKNIGILADAAQKIAEAVNTSYSNFNNSEYWAAELEDSLSQNEDALKLASSLEELEGELTDLPTLIYDGPYSDHLLDKEPELIKESEEVSEEKALQTALLAADIKEGSLNLQGIVDGKIPAYLFSGNGLTLTVSRAGGHTVYMRKDRSINTNILSIEQAREKAKRYLGRIGMSGFKETYYFLNEGILLINFAYVDGETICYTDLIKVGIAMDNGEVVLYEAAGFISNHRERAFLTPVYSAEQAKEVLNKKLIVNGVGLALIPTDSDEERCYEFACTAPDGQEILVYINASNLEEEDVLILLKSDGGTLVK